MLVASLMCRPLRRADHHCCASVPCTTYTLFFEIIGIGSEKYGGVSRRRLETFGAQKREVMSRSGCQPWKHARSMPYSRLLCDVDMAEEVEIRRLEGIYWRCVRDGVRGCGGSFVYVVLWLLGSGTRNGDGKQGGEQQAGVGAGRTRGAGDGVRRASRASLAARKNYRKAEDIDLKLPQASTALGGAPRMRNYARTEEGRREWKEAFSKHAGGFAYPRTWRRAQ